MGCQKNIQGKGIESSRKSPMKKKKNRVVASTRLVFNTFEDTMKSFEWKNIIISLSGSV